MGVGRAEGDETIFSWNQIAIMNIHICLLPLY